VHGGESFVGDEQLDRLVCQRYCGALRRVARKGDGDFKLEVLDCIFLFYPHLEFALTGRLSSVETAVLEFHLRGVEVNLDAVFHVSRKYRRVE
jgi:hypothetical protein